MARAGTMTTLIDTTLAMALDRASRASGALVGSTTAGMLVHRLAMAPPLRPATIGIAGLEHPVSSMM